MTLVCETKNASLTPEGLGPFWFKNIIAFEIVENRRRNKSIRGMQNQSKQEESSYIQEV